MSDVPADSPGLIVMYHYVRPDGSAIPGGIRPLLASEFEKQLDWLAARYTIVGADEFLRKLNRRPRVEALAGAAPRTTTARHAETAHGATAVRVAQQEFDVEHKNAKPICLLTFDDGTKDHAQIVTPILRRRGLSGVFFIVTWPPELKKMPLTHALHWLLSQGDDIVWEIFQRYAKDHLGGENALGDPAQAAKIYHYEAPIRARIKYAANMALAPEATERIIESAVKAGGRTMKGLAEEWFVSPKDIREMNAAGMTIALHGCSHRSLQTLGGAGMAAEIQQSSAYITKLTGRRPTWFACPFGASGASPDAVAKMKAAMVKAGIVASMATEKRYLDADVDRYALPRFDAIDLPPRKKI
jgi:peptidoglycan/xylan/chitin deacetylase (PgdA/CDA1 family)